MPPNADSTVGDFKASLTAFRASGPTSLSAPGMALSRIRACNASSPEFMAPAVIAAMRAMFSSSGFPCSSLKSRNSSKASAASILKPSSITPAVNNAPALAVPALNNAGAAGGKITLPSAAAPRAGAAYIAPRPYCEPSCGRNSAPPTRASPNHVSAPKSLPVSVFRFNSPSCFISSADMGEPIR